MPITWRNVNAPSFNGVSESLAQAGQSFTGAVDALQQTKDTFEDGRTDRNTQAFMDQIAQYQSPEALAEAQQSGAIQKLRDQYGGNGLIETSKTNADAMRGRLTGLRQQETADYDYNRTLNTRADQPFLEQIGSQMSEIPMDMPQDQAAARLEAIHAQAVEGGASERVLTVFNEKRRDLLEGIEDENRSDATHAYNLERRGWEKGNQAYKQNQRARTIAQQQREDAQRAQMDTLLDQEEQIVNDFTTGLDTTSQGVLKAAADIDIPIVNGRPVFSEATPEQLAKLQQNTQGMGRLSYKDAQAQYVEALDAAGIKGEERTKRMAGFQARMEVPTNLSPKREAALQSTLDAGKKEHDTQLARLKEDRARFNQSNGYVDLDGRDPNTVVADLLQEINDDTFAEEGEDVGIDLWGLLSNSKGNAREKITKSASRAVSEGMPITLEDGSTSSVRATEGMLRQAFVAAKRAENPAKVFDSVLRDILSRPGNIAQWESNQNSIERFRQQEDKLNSDYLRSVAFHKNLANYEDGIPTVDLPAFKARLDRALKPDMTEKEVKTTMKEAAESITGKGNASPKNSEPGTQSADDATTARINELEAALTKAQKMVADGNKSGSESAGRNIGELLKGLATATDPTDPNNIIREGYSNIADWTGAALRSTGDKIPFSYKRDENGKIVDTNSVSEVLDAKSTELVYEDVPNMIQSLMDAGVYGAKGTMQRIQNYLKRSEANNKDFERGLMEAMKGK
jgi:hypothetical protein